MTGKMIAAWLKGPRDYRIEEVDIPTVGPGQVLVKVDKVGICGSDRGIWEGVHFFNDLHDWDDFDPGEHGHESSGTVVEVSPGVRGVNAGDLVTRLTISACHDMKMQSFAQYVVADEPIVVNGGDPEVVCFADPVTVALVHMHAADVHPGDTVLVIGQGFIGLVLTQLLRRSHVNVVATEVIDRKLELSRRFGAHAVDARTSGYEEEIRDAAGHIDAVVECSGKNETVDLACDMVGKGGRIVIMGSTRKRIEFHYTPLRVKGATVCFPSNAINCPDYWEPAARILQKSEIEVKGLIDRREKLTDLQAVLENYKDEYLRVVVEPW
jgi:L-iditol 2-dehydrogenase